MRRQGKDFSGRETPLFPTMMVQAQQEHGEGSEVPTDPQHPSLLNLHHLNLKGNTNLGGLRRRTLRVGRSTRVVSSEEASLGDQEDASKQGRKIDDIDKDAEITLVDETQGRYGDEDMFGVNDLDGDEVVVESEVTDKAGEKRNIVEEAVVVTDVVTILVSAATITNVELTLAQTLVELKSARPKTKGVVMQEPSESTPTISLQLPSQVKGQGSKDKGKAKMIEPEKPLKKKDQIKFDEEEALRLQAKFDEEDRLAREKAQQVEEANIAWDDIQAKIDADYQLAKRLQAQEQQELTIEEKSTLFVQLLKKRKKYFAAKRNMAGWKPKDLKNKSFANIQELFDKAMKRVNTFVDMDTDLVEGSEVRAEGSETREESSSKRAGDELEQENAKKQKVDDDQEVAKMKELMKIVPDEEEVAVDAIPLATKPPSIMLRSFDREDLETLWKLVKAKHGYTRPEEGYERVLWGDLKMKIQSLLQQIIVSLNNEFDMTDLGVLNYFLGISADRTPTCLFLSQKKYALQLLERAYMVTCNPSRTPIDTESKLVQQICLYMHDPREPHFAALKCILRYVQGTVFFGLQLYVSATTSLVGYTDADWAGCPSTRSAKAEYRGVANVVAEITWIRNLLRELHSPLSTATLVYCDNASAIYMSANPVQHQRTKHIEIDIYFVRDMVTAGHVCVLHVPSRFQYADIFTKRLLTALFEDFRSSLSVRPPPAQTAGAY
ncbi:ribonuclease H-like domain-containing protein [Tanacetum coccineum]